MNKRNALINTALSAMFLAVAFVLPFVTGQIPQIGAVLCPMHIPVMLCGFVCGAPWGLLVGFIAPLLRSVIFGVPVLLPMAVSMAFELAVYGAVCGLLYRIFPAKKGYIFCTLFIAMVAGRLMRGLVQFAQLGFDPAQFGFSAFWAGAVVNALPGIALQIIIIPAAVMLMEKAGVIKKNI
jgi:thiamine transporter ThiT